MAPDSHGRVDRRSLIKSTGVAAAVGLAGCGGNGNGNGNGTGGNGETPSDGDGGTPTEQGPSDRSEPYLNELPDYYPESYWRTIDGAMDESGQTLYTAYFGAMAESTVEGFNEVFDFIDWNITTLGTAEVYSRFTTEASRGQINPDVLFTYDPIAMRQLFTAGLLEERVSPEVSEAPSGTWPDRTQTDIDGLVQNHHSWGTHVWHPPAYMDNGFDTPPSNHDLDWFTDHIEDNPDFYQENVALYDGITSTSGWQQMDFYSVANGEDWMTQQYEEMATTNPRSFWSTSTLGGWVANGEVAYGMGLAQWIVAAFIAQDFDVGNDVSWGEHVMHNIMHPAWQSVADASNSNSGRLFADWTRSQHGNAWIAREWNLGPGRTDIPSDQLSTDPVWGVTTGLEDIQQADNMSMLDTDSILMPFEDRTVRSDQKATYKDQWYNIFA